MSEGSELLHIGEDELLAYAAHAIQGADRTVAIEQHLAACEACRHAVDFFRMADDDLRDQEVWDPTSGSATHTVLMAYGAQIAAEDQEAAELLEPFLDSPAITAWTTELATRRRFRTGGVVRKLNTHAHAIRERDPLAALTFADSAIAIAEHLPDDLYPANAVYALRARAWRERGSALMSIAEFPDALAALGRAETAYNQLPEPSLGLSIVALARAGILYEQQRLDEANTVAQQAEAGFAHLGEDKYRREAVFLRASIQYEAGEIDRAVSTFREVLQSSETLHDLAWIVRACHAIGGCELARRNLEEAGIYLQRALVTAVEIGSDLDRLAAEWGLARIVLYGGRYREAIGRLRAVAARFETRRMVTDAALVGLDTADALLALGRFTEIAELAQHLFVTFTDAGMLTGALSAIAYLRESARAGESGARSRLTAKDVDWVRGFLRRAERQPALQFLAPPPHPDRESI